MSINKKISNWINSFNSMPIKKRILIAATILIFSVALTSELIFSPIKRFFLYDTLDTFVSFKVDTTEVTNRPGPGKIILTPPPIPNPSIFKLDRQETEKCYAINFADVPGNPMFQIELEAYVNMKGVLEKPKIISESDNDEADNYIFNRIKNWKYTPYAEGKIIFTITAGANEAIIDLSDNSFKVSAEKIAIGRYLGYFINNKNKKMKVEF